MSSRRITLTLLLAMLFAAPVVADDSKLDKEKPKELDQQALFKKFEETLSGSKLVGRFTIVSKQEQAPTEEEYTIAEVKKLDEGDYWLFRARIKYGEHDLTVPLRLQVKWAGDTPVITLTDFTIPLMGTFSSRVVIDNNKYAGTWTHGEVGGHLFGKIVKLQAEEKKDAQDKGDDKK